MIRKDLFLEITEEIAKTIESIEFLLRVRLEDGYFIKKGQLGLKNMIMLMLNLLKKTLQIELDGYFETVLGSEQRPRKQGFSKRRQKISPDAFTILIEKQIAKTYTATDLKTYRNYKLFGVDGTTLELENTGELRDYFGYAENKTTKVARAKASALYDIENDIIVDAIIDKYNTPERELAKRHIEALTKYGLKNDMTLILYDRGYPSKDFIAHHIDNNMKFLMRVQKSFIKEIDNVKGQDEEVVVNYAGNDYRMRVFKFLLDSGEEETLATNIFEPDFTVRDAKALYFKRWGIEVKYNIVKHRLQIENFSGKKPIAVLQDFFANIFLQNMASLAKMQSDEVIHEKNIDKGLKYEYQTNINILVGKLKYNMVLMLLEKNDEKRSKMYQKIMTEITNNVVPIRPDRHFERKFKCNRDRYPMNARKSL